MDSYSGPATVTTETTTVDVRAELRTDRTGALRSWAGRLHFDDEVDAWTVFAAHQALLTLPDGSVGTVICTSRSAGSTLVVVTGSGPAPY
ncbi:DUF4873 domain-containing protein [Kitasatospora sp. NPDC004272]